MVDRTILRSALEASSRGDWGALSEALGMSPVASPLDFVADTTTEFGSRLTGAVLSLHRAGAFEHGGARAALWVAALPEWGGRPADRERVRRRIAKALVEVAPAGDRNTLIVLTAEGMDDVEFVLPRLRSNGALGTIRAIVSRSNPNRHHLELLEDLVLAEGMGTAAITRRWSDAFSVERVTDTFYKEFRLLRDRFVRVLIDSNPGHRLLDPGDDETKQADLRRFVTRNLGRVLFLWFIQAKGWLGGDTSYLVNLYARTAGAHRNYFTEALLPLFFDTLAVEPPRRTEKARSLGDIPYLNGGLFVPTALEDTLYGDGREHVDIIIPNELFDPRTHDSGEPTLLGLLSSYRFTTQESTPDDLSVDPDPELLGKVFENLNEDRKKTGTFYTPREIVRFMCREALDGYLVDRTGVTRETLSELRLEAIDPTATEMHLSSGERARLEEALLSVTVCDPAVGSGAFPVGMLQEIVQLLIGIEQSADVHVRVGGQKVAEWKEAVITNCLYGVDINPEAVEICQLRLWLSMVVDAERPVPLPNLDFRFEAGDSLVDRVGQTRLGETLPRDGHQDQILFGDLAEIGRELESLRAEYAIVRDSVRARELRREIKAKQLDLVKRQVAEKFTGTKQSLAGKQARLDQLRRMGAGARDLKREEKEADELVERCEHLREVLDGLSPDAPHKKPFLWPVEFPEVFEQGGFDIVIANPPYVRMEHMSGVDELSYRLSFQEVYEGRADLLVYFYRRALHILRAEGHYAFITSSSFVKRRYGLPLQSLLARSTTVLAAVDFGELPVFDATVEPLILIGKYTTPPVQHEINSAALEPCVRRLAKTFGATGLRETRDILAAFDQLLASQSVSVPQSGLLGERWLLEEARVLELMRRLKRMPRTLGEILTGHQFAGVKTGLNDAFVLDGDAAMKILDNCPAAATMLRPWFRGADVTVGGVKWSGDYVIYAARGVRMEDFPPVFEHLAVFRRGLEARATSSLHPWYELQQPQQGAAELWDHGKLVWPDIARTIRFGWDEAGLVADMTAFVAFDVPKWTVGLLNSMPCRFMIHLLAGTYPGGFTRMKQDYLAPLPIPEINDEVAERLSVLPTGDEHQDVEILRGWDLAAQTAYQLDGDDMNVIRSWFENRDVGGVVR